MEEISEDKELPKDEEKKTDSDRKTENESDQQSEEKEESPPKDTEMEKASEGGGDGDEKSSAVKKGDSEIQPETTKDETTIQMEASQDNTKTQTEAAQDIMEDKQVDTDVDVKSETGVKKEDEEIEGDDVEEVRAGEAEPVITTSRRKKKGPKTRQVNMNVYYPDELSGSAEESTKVKEGVKVEAAAIVKHSDDSMIYTPLGDYSERDPSFVDELFSSEEELVKAVKKAHEVGEESVGGLKEEEEEEEEFQQEIYIQPPDKEISDMIYDQICDLETPISTDESLSVPRFKYIHRRKRRKGGGYDQEGDMAASDSGHSLEAASTTGMRGMKYLMELVIPTLKKTLIDVALYQPQDPVRYMTYSLLHQTKTPAELDMDPDPHLIQALVDGQKKKKKVTAKKPDIVFVPLGESYDALPTVDVPTPVPTPKEEDPSHIDRFQQKYKTAKKKLLSDEKEMRSTVSRRDMLPGACLGPTSLPLPPEPVASGLRTRQN